MIKKILLFFCYILICKEWLFAQKSDIKVLNLKTEYKINPIIETTKPRLSWELQSKERNQNQTAYHVIVASSLNNANSGNGDVWDSREIKGNQTNQIEYAGKPLKSRNIYYWRVKSWDKNGVPSLWSEVATWEMGLMEKADWKANWIGNYFNYP